MNEHSGSDEPIPTTREALAAHWNELGRAHFRDACERITRHYLGERGVDLALRDPRSPALGHAVMREVLAMRAEGRQHAIRATFDPAYAPLLPWFERTNRALDFVTLLGPDELLVRRGSPWQSDAVMLHLRGGEARELEGVVGACRSRNRDHLILARTSGLELRDARAGLDAPPIATLAWPHLSIFRPRGLDPDVAWVDDGRIERLALERLEVSDDGRRVVVSCYRQGILLASLHEGETPWTLLWPDARAPYAHDSDPAELTAGDMTHVAISRDGRRVAFGSQDAGHFVAELDAAGQPQWYATVGHLSEYPHDACFSADGRYLALNSCHFYSGATVCFDLEGHRGLTLEQYEVHPAAPCIDPHLRVYASCWLDRTFVETIVGADAAPEMHGLFLLAGAGLFRIVSTTGAVVAAQSFGSSASSVDFCPETRRIALASYSGVVHVYASDEPELDGRIDGFRARRELYRWLTWEQLPGGPLRW